LGTGESAWTYRRWFFDSAARLGGLRLLETHLSGPPPELREFVEREAEHEDRTPAQLVRHLNASPPGQGCSRSRRKRRPRRVNCDKPPDNLPHSAALPSR